MTLYFRSHTAAMKASALLSENNIPNKTGKSTVRNLGCVYTAEIRNDFEKAQTLLRENEINYISGAGGMRYEHKSD